ncbi:MAG: hypothetical protein WA057_04770 [Candidatus Magasanikiibacteriota bacterium]
MKNVISVFVLTLFIFIFVSCSNKVKQSQVTQTSNTNISTSMDEYFYLDPKEEISVPTLAMSKRKFNRLANYVEKHGTPDFTEREYRFWTEHDYILRDSLNNIHHFHTFKNDQSKIISILVDVYKNDDNDPRNFFAQYWINPTGITFFQHGYAGYMDDKIVNCSYKLFLAQANKKI